jgi:hypothetical protein
MRKPEGATLLKAFFIGQGSFCGIKSIKSGARSVTFAVKRTRYSSKRRDVSAKCEVVSDRRKKNIYSLLRNLRSV